MELFEHTLTKLSEHIASRGIRKRLEHPDYDAVFGERICKLIFDFYDQDIAKYDVALQDFIEFGIEFLKLQMELDRTGKYGCDSNADAQNAVLNDPGIMERRYLTGLLFSQAFWINHYFMYRFFENKFCKNLDQEGNVLEVPVGTGVFIAEFMQHNSGWNAQGVDVSACSVA